MRKTEVCLGVSPEDYNRVLREKREVEKQKETLVKGLLEIRKYLLRADKMMQVVSFIDDVLIKSKAV